MTAKPAADYVRLTEQALREDQAYCEAATPLPDSLTPEQKAENLRQLSGASYLYGATVDLLVAAFDVPTYKAYLDGFLQEAGAPTDPVERLLLEQLALAHHVIGRLHVRAGARDRLEEVELFLAAAARLQGEFRRSALALKTYRQPQTGKGTDDVAGQQREPGRQTPVANNHRAEQRKIVPQTEIGSKDSVGRQHSRNGHHEHQPTFS